LGIAIGPVVRSLLLLLVAMLVGIGVWLWRDPAQFARLAERAKPSLSPATSSGITATTGPLRKCLRGSEVLYTNDNCPAGTQDVAIKGGALSVLPAAPVVAPPAPQAASEPSMKEKQIDRIIGR
jgi:hypothetical protein